MIKEGIKNMDAMAAGGISGTWYMQNTAGAYRYELKQVGNKLSGEWYFSDGQACPLTGEINGDKVSFTVTAPGGRKEVRGEYSGKNLHIAEQTFFRGGDSSPVLDLEYRRIDVITEHPKDLTGLLLGAYRPGRYSPSVTKQVVDEWITDMKWLGIKTIICLLDGEHLGLYTHLHQQSLLGMYNDAGFCVKSRPVEDTKRHPFVQDGDLEVIGNDFKKEQKPVLVHCSAGEQRTGSVVKYLNERFGSGEETFE